MLRFMKRLILILGLVASAFYLLRRRIIALILRIRPPEFSVRVTRDIRITAGDAALATDHYAPAGRRASHERFPTILIRSPYGRNRRGGAMGLLLEFVAQRYAERGYHVVLQDVRGRGESGGDFVPFNHEREDGLATVEWITAQPWFNNELATWGGSYLGIVQWAIADRVPSLKAMMVAISSSDLQTIVFPDGAFDLSLALHWLTLFELLDTRGSLSVLPNIDRMTDRAALHLPLAQADSAALKQPLPFFKEWLSRKEFENLWQDLHYDCQVAEVRAPVCLISGWYDVFLRGTLRDYQKLRESGQRPHLTVGSWTHFQEIVSMQDARQGLVWFDAHIKHRAMPPRKPVRLFVMGANQWREFDDYPPPATSTALYLRADKRLTFDAPDGIEPADEYDYDPFDPTPALGGTQLSLSAGRRDNRKLESRPDVLVYTSAPLERPLEIIGPVRLELHVEPDLEYADFYGRLTDVHPDGRSINLCDGLTRITPQQIHRAPDGKLCIEVDLWATAHQFKRGHRIRLIVASGAHPRWARNLGHADQIMSAEGQRVHHRVYHDLLHPSALHLPVTLR